MTITHQKPIAISQATKSLSVNDDIKREVTIYNTTRQNVIKAMKFLIQAKVPISRPDDFFAEMLKTDSHMNKIKGRLLVQQKKMSNFEDKKQKMESRKFHKAIK